MKVIHPILLGLLTALGSFAANAELNQPIKLEIGSQVLRDALNDWAQQTGFQLIAPTSEVTNRFYVSSVKGVLTPTEALDRMLADTPLTYELLSDRVVAIREKNQASFKVRQLVATANELVESQPLTLANDPSSGNLVAQSGQSGGNAAQREAARQSEESRYRALEEVIVTAQKREQNLQDVPLSIAAISAQDIERRGLIGMEDYLRSVPSVNQVDRGSVDNAIIIRGVATAPENETFSTGSTTVATYFDETPITAAAGGVGVDVRPVDIERIEILRGPQGTAYGSSSLGGTLRIIPVKPKLDGFAAKAAASYSQTEGLGGDNTMAQGVLNAPIADTFALRAVAYRYDDSGYFKNIGGADPTLLGIAERAGVRDYVSGYSQNDVGRMISIGSRVAALWAPNDDLDLTLTYATQKIEQDGAPEATLGAFLQARIPTAPQTRVRGERGELSDTDMDLVSAVLNYGTTLGTLTTVGSWVDGNAIFARDFTYLFARPNTSIQDTHSKTVSGEVRFASELSGPLQFLVGAYYEKVDYRFDQTVDWVSTPESNPFTGRTNPSSPLFSTMPLLLSVRDRELEQQAVFGEISYDFFDKLTATVGGRFFEYDKTELSLREGVLASVPLGQGVTRNLKKDEDNSSFKANLSYEPTDDSLIYLSWSEGFRLGRPDTGLAQCDLDGNGIVDGTSLTVESTQTIASDFLENYELGTKVSLFGRRMAVDASVYHIKWDGLPMRLLLPAGSSCNFAYVANVGAATSDGVEVQASVFLTDALRVDFGGSYTKAELSKDAPPTVQPRAFEGDRLPGSPEVSANLAAQYDFEIGNYSAFVRADSFYTGKFYGDLAKTPNTVAGDYVKVDARAGLSIKNLNVELFVRNLTNENAFTWRALNSSRGQDFGYLLRPRTIGLQLGYSFD